MSNILVINPGATSTKLAYFVDGKKQTEHNIRHDVEHLRELGTIADQLPLRLEITQNFLSSENIPVEDLDAVAARGGLLPPLASGGYIVNEPMIDYLTHRPRVEHASNLGALIAAEIARQHPDKIDAYIYDPVTVDEMAPVAKISGLNGIERESIGHALNMKSVARQVAADCQQDYDQETYIVAHLGGGNSVSLHHNGKMIDLISDDEGPFSTERTGSLPLKKVIQWCYTHSEEEMMTLYRKTGGFYSYFQTNDLRIIEERMNAGDLKAKQVLDAFVYQTASAIGGLSTAVCGKVTAIVITGGVAHSDYLMDELRKMVDFLAPVFIKAGENEMFALASGIQRILDQQEKPHLFNG